VKNKEIAVIGLGKMGYNLVLRLLNAGWTVFAYDKEPTVGEDLSSKGAVRVDSVMQLVEAFSSRRLVWLMVPSTEPEPVDETLTTLLPLLNEEDIVIDGGNSKYKLSIRRGEEAKKCGVHFVDVGVSGGPAGALSGACLMVGGELRVTRGLEHLFQDLSWEGNSFELFDGMGAGHFVKMVHNAIEYGMMQSIAEGFNFIRTAFPEVSLRDVAQIYTKRSVVSSRLVSWMLEGFEFYGENLDGVSGEVGHTGEAQWTLEDAEERGVDLQEEMPAILASMKFRWKSAGNPTFIGRILSTLRNMFGGHAVKTK